MMIITNKKRKIKNAKICKDCNRVIDGINIKGMKCSDCGADICYKCNITYKCHDCYNKLRNEYYEEKKIEVIQ